MSRDGLRIYTYHNVAESPAGAPLAKLYVTPDEFARQCAWLAKLGMRGVSMSEGYRALRAGNARKLVAITLDDGYQDNLDHAAQVLAKHGFGATCYVVSDTIGGHNAWDKALGVHKPMMDEAALQQWLAHGLEIGAHSRTHAHLDQLDADGIEEEVSGCRQKLQALTGTPVEHFCYPYGHHSDAVVEAVRRAGYVTATTTQKGIARAEDDPLRLPRISINGGRGIGKFLLYSATTYAGRRRG